MQSKKFKIGLEIHVRLKGDKKLFSDSLNRVLGRENSRTDIYDLALPGTMPKLNASYVYKALKMALILEAEIARYLSFDRKHYRYPDLPSGYQVTQHYNPIATNGCLDIGGKKIRFSDIHLEVDAAKTLRDGEDWIVDYNRCGVPLLEMVTYPDIRSLQELRTCLKYLRNIIIRNNLSKGDMSKGDMRFDINFSVEGGLRQEIKNMNSIKFASEAVEELLKMESREASKKQFTWEWSEGEKRLKPMREKVNEGGYLYLREPDLPIYRLKFDRQEILSKIREEGEFFKEIDSILKNEVRSERVVLSKHKMILKGVRDREIFTNLCRLLSLNLEPRDSLIGELLEHRGKLNDRELMEAVDAGRLELRKFKSMEGLNWDTFLIENDKDWKMLIQGDLRSLNILTGILRSQGFDPREANSALRKKLEEFKNET